VILGLLSHENPDVAADAVELIHELTDADAVESNEAGGKALVASIVVGPGRCCSPRHRMPLNS